METLAQKSARIEFALRAQISDEQRQRLMMEFTMRRTAEQNVAAEKRRREDAEFVAVMSAVLAPTYKIEQFTVKLDRYDTAMVQALMDNERDTLAKQEEFDGMLMKAHVLPDGRRAFKSLDGRRVMDESGAELKPEEVDPVSIDNAKPKWEEFDAAGQALSALRQERKDLINYQEKLDHARERTKDPTLTESELSALDKELGDGMPPRMRKLVGNEGPDQKPESVAPARDDTQPALERARTVVTPAVFQP